MEVVLIRNTVITILIVMERRLMIEIVSCQSRYDRATIYYRLNVLLILEFNFGIATRTESSNK